MVNRQSLKSVVKKNYSTRVARMENYCPFAQLCSSELICLHLRLSLPLCNIASYNLYGKKLYLRHQAALRQSSNTIV